MRLYEKCLASLLKTLKTLIWIYKPFKLIKIIKSLKLKRLLMVLLKKLILLIMILISSWFKLKKGKVEKTKGLKKGQININLSLNEQIQEVNQMKLKQMKFKKSVNQSIKKFMLTRIKILIWIIIIKVNIQVLHCIIRRIVLAFSKVLNSALLNEKINLKSFKKAWNIWNSI